MKERLNSKLLVEGNDDLHVIKALCNKYEINENFDVIDCKGYDKLIQDIPVYFKQSNIETIGVVVDADTDISSRWNALRQIFLNQQYEIPNEFPSEGLVINVPDKIKIGLWIMPNNNTNGMLEDFIAFLVPNEDKLFPIIQKNINSIEKKKLNNYKPSYKAKAEIHSWLALQEEPGTPLGLSITKRYLTTDNESCTTFINWINQLFE